jgi:hypothetical protein
MAGTIVAGPARLFIGGELVGADLPGWYPR